MFCTKCRYSLVGLDYPRCPECGQAFDPGDPSTYRTFRRPPRWFDRLCLATSLFPLLLPLGLYATWLAATLSLGHRPQPYADDPKFINVWVSMLHDATWIVLVALPPMFLANLAFVGMAIARRFGAEGRWSWRTFAPAALMLTTWMAAIFLVRIGGRTLGCWFFD